VNKNLASSHSLVDLNDEAAACIASGCDDVYSIGDGICAKVRFSARADVCTRVGT